jgi:hypothetical protein
MVLVTFGERYKQRMKLWVMDRIHLSQMHVAEQDDELYSIKEEEEFLGYLSDCQLLKKHPTPCLICHKRQMN